jgi:predicted RNA-binding protein with PUA-like domain
MKYWLFKSEPDTFSLNDLKKSRNKTTCWEGVRNYQARNFIRDDMKLGDKVLFYHSSTEIPAIVGLCTITKESYPDFTAFETENIHYDPKSQKDNPIWFMVDIKFVEEFSKAVSLRMIKENQRLKNMKLIQRGNRLSVMPVTKDEFNEILKLAGKI